MVGLRSCRMALPIDQPGSRPPTSSPTRAAKPALVAVASLTLEKLALEQRWASVRAAWAAGTPPDGLVATVADHLDHGTMAADTGAVQAVLVLGPVDAKSPVLAKFLRRCQERETPVLLAVTAEQPHRGVTAPGQGLVAISEELGDGVVAGVLLGLIEGHGRVSQLRREVHLEQQLKESAASQLAYLGREIDLASRVQRAFLPSRLPDAPGMEAGVLFRPSSTLSGDIYNVVPLDDETVAFFVADACGHGVPAAMLTMLIANLLQMKEVIAIEAKVVPPGEVLRRFNRQFIARRADDSTLITALYGLMNTRTGEVTFASAGHPPPIVVGTGGMRPLDGSGPAIGLFEEADFPVITTHLEMDQTLLLYTDGFEQAFVAEADAAARRRRPSELYRDFFLRFFANRRTGSLPEAIEALAVEMDQQHGSLHPLDDITLLGIGRTPTRAAGIELVAAPVSRAA